MGTRGRTGVVRDPRAGAALAASVGLHVLALLLWRQMPQPVLPPVPAAPRIVTILLRPPMAPVPAAADLAGKTIHAAAQPAGAPSPATAAAPAASPPALAPLPRPIDRSSAPPDTSAPPAPDPADAATDQPSSATLPAVPADAAATGTPTTPQGGTPAGGFSAGLARRQAGRIDRELRGNKPGVPQEADTPWARFRRDVESAHVESSMSVREDMYTAPDGVVIYRFRQGNQVRCQRSGSVGLGIPGAGGINDAGPVSCPKGASWRPVD